MLCQGEWVRVLLVVYYMGRGLVLEGVIGEGTCGLIELVGRFKIRNGFSWKDLGVWKLGGFIKSFCDRMVKSRNWVY